MPTQIFYDIASIAVSGLAAGAIAVLPKLTKLLTAKEDSIKNDALRGVAEAATQELEKVIGAVVASTKQTVVDTIKSKSGTGTLTAAEARAVKSKVIADVNSILSDEAKAVLSGNYGNLEVLISHLIEQTVAEKKKVSFVFNDTVAPVMEEELESQTS